MTPRTLTPQRWTRWLHVLTLACATAFTAAQGAETPRASTLLPVETFFGPSQLGSADLSPSGRWLAVTVQPAGQRIGLAVYDLHGGEPPQEIARFSDMDVGEVHWVGDDRLVFDLLNMQRGSADQRLGSGLFSVRRDGSEIRHLILMQWWKNPQRGTRSSRRLDILHRLVHVPLQQVPGAEMVIVHGPSQDVAGEYVLKRLNIATGVVEALNAAGPPRARRWLFDAAGQPLFATVVDDDGEATLYERVVDAQGAPQPDWKTMLRYKVLDAPWLLHSRDHAGRVYVTQNSGPRGERVLKRWDRTRNAPEAQPLVTVPGFDFTGTLVQDRSPDSADPLLGVRALADAPSTVWLHAEMAAIQKAVDERLPGRTNSLHCSRCRQADRTVVVVSSSDRMPGEFWLWRGPADAPTAWRRIGVRRRAVDPRQMAELNFTRFKARDGLEIPLWVTLPQTQAAGPMPAVVLVHGGPWVRGGIWAWNAMPQFLASRGYVVIEPEFRGSAGYGAQLERAGDRQWGRAMQTDLADAVAWAVQRGLVDGKRVCIAGGSYGGYAALMGLATQGDIFRCGAAWAPVADLEWLLGSSDLDDFAGFGRTELLPLRIADRSTSGDAVRQISPLHQAERIHAPLLLAWGEKDSRTPPKQVEPLVSRLEALGRPPEVVIYPGEGHSWLKVETRLDFARRLEAFLARSLGGAEAPR